MSEDAAPAQVVAIFLSPARHQPVAAAPAARALAGHGLEGDAHARPGSARQMLLMDRESLDALGIQPGDLKESVTTQGFPLYEQRPGQRVRVGAAVLELTQLCSPCGHTNEVRPGLQQELAGRRGYLARVVESGEIRVGDAVEVV